MLGEIQQQSREVVHSLQATVSESEGQTQLIHQAIEINQAVSTQIHQLADTIAIVGRLSDDMTAQKEVMVESLQSIASSAEENSAGTEEVSANAEEILATMEEFSENIRQVEEVAKRLKQSADAFQLESITQTENSTEQKHSDPQDEDIVPNPV